VLATSFCDGLASWTRASEATNMDLHRQVSRYSGVFQQSLLSWCKERFESVRQGGSIVSRLLFLLSACFEQATTSRKATHLIQSARKRVTVEGAPCNPAMIAQGLWMAACAVKINWRACKFSWLPREVIDRYEDGAVGWYSSATEGEWCTWLQAPRLAWHCSFPSEFAMPAPSAEDRARLEPLLAPTRQYCSVSFYSNTPAIAIPGKT
jgi:hypothetical protein